MSCNLKIHPDNADLGIDSEGKEFDTQKKFEKELKDSFLPIGERFEKYELDHPHLPLALKIASHFEQLDCLLSIFPLEVCSIKDAPRIRFIQDFLRSALQVASEEDPLQAYRKVIETDVFPMIKK